MSWFVNLIKRFFKMLGESAPEEHHISFDADLFRDELPSVSCTCGWGCGPTRFCHLVIEARDHSSKTGHIYPSYDERLHV